MLFLLACSNPTPGQDAADAFARASTGAPDAAEACSALPTGTLAADCTVAWVRAVPLDTLSPTLCNGIPAGRWRGECHFVQAERWMEADDPDAAIAACGRADPFVVDCAQHLWKQVSHREQDPDVLRPFLARLAHDLPQAASVLDPDGRATRRLLARERLADTEHLSAALCADDPTPACESALTRLLQKRWEREAAVNAEAKAILCAGNRLPDPDEHRVSALLRWEPSPALDEAVRAAQVATCGR